MDYSRQLIIGVIVIITIVVREKYKQYISMLMVCLMLVGLDARMANDSRQQVLPNYQMDDTVRAHFRKE